MIGDDAKDVVRASYARIATKASSYCSSSCCGVDDHYPTTILELYASKPKEVSNHEKIVGR